MTCLEFHTNTRILSRQFWRELQARRTLDHCVEVAVFSGTTVPPESIYPLGRGKTSSLPKGSTANSPRWEEFLNLVLDGRDRMPRQARRGIPR